MFWLASTFPSLHSSNFQSQPEICHEVFARLKKLNPKAFVINFFIVTDGRWLKFLDGPLKTSPSLIMQKLFRKAFHPWGEEFFHFLYFPWRLIIWGKFALIFIAVEEQLEDCGWTRVRVYSSTQQQVFFKLCVSMKYKRKQTSLNLKHFRCYPTKIVCVGECLDSVDEWNIIMNTFWQIIMMMLDGCCCCGSSNENESHYYWSEFIAFFRMTRELWCWRRLGEICVRFSIIHLTIIYHVEASLLYISRLRFSAFSPPMPFEY